MCGIVGVVARPGAFGEPDIRRAVSSLHHRGPDGAGVMCVSTTDRWQVWFGHARLAIVDLTSGGDQPMRRGDAALVFNGEVYAHEVLRTELSGPFRTRSDTETLLLGLVEKGPTFLRETNAMLALGFYDGRTQTLLLARDRVGKKPLYVYEGKDVFAFASELKAFAALGLPLSLDERGLSYFRWLGYIPATHTIYRECRKFRAGSFGQIDLSGTEIVARKTQLYWDPLAAFGERFAGTFDDAVDEVLARIDDATRIRSEADVPVGVFLSGGIDSTLVASSVAAQHRDVKAFVVRTDDAALDESAVAQETGRALGLEVCVLDFPRSAYAAQVERAAFYYDEPLAHFSGIATMANAELARRHATVVLTGDGGDEGFLGYPWLAHPLSVWRVAQTLRRLHVDRAVPPIFQTRFGRSAVGLVSRALGKNTETSQEKIDVLLHGLTAPRPEDLYEHFTAIRARSALSRADQERLGPDSLLTRLMRWYPDYAWSALEGRSAIEVMGAIDLLSYLRDGVLVKVDRGTMAYSLEARSPLLDYRILALGASLPLNFKVRDGVYKRVLRAACARRVPSVAKLKKKGWGVAGPANVAPHEVSRWWAAEMEKRWFARWRSGAPHAPERAPIASSSAL